MSRIPRSKRNYRGGGRNFIRKNERIRAREVRLIGPEGTQIGVVSSDEAKRLAKQVGLDLVEISPNARPPVCRILDFGKYQYELSKKNKDKAKSTSSKLKEVKFRVRIGEHDRMTKLRHAEEFLFKGNKVKMSLMFRGREMEHTELGFAVVKEAMKDLEHVGQQDTPPKLNGRNINAVMSPLPVNKRKLKFNEHVEPEDTSKKPEDEHHDEDDHDDHEEFHDDEEGFDESDDRS